MVVADGRFQSVNMALTSPAGVCETEECLPGSVAFELPPWSSSTEQASVALQGPVMKAHLTILTAGSHPIRAQRQAPDLSRMLANHAQHIR